MKLLLLLLLAGSLAVLPFAMLKRPWAVRLWHRARLLFIIYALVILLSALASLIFRWDSIYG